MVALMGSALYERQRCLQPPATPAEDKPKISLNREEVRAEGVGILRPIASLPVYRFEGIRRVRSFAVVSKRGRGSDLHEPETDLEGGIDPRHRGRVEQAHAPSEPLAID